MRNSTYRVNSEDKTFPQGKYYNDIKFRNNTNDSFFNRAKRYIKLNLKWVIILSSVAIVLIIAIILISYYSTRKSKKDKVIHEEWKGGFLTLKLSNLNQNDEDVSVFNYGQMGLNSNDFSVNVTKNLRTLNEGKETKDIYEFKNNHNYQEISFSIKFKKPLTSMHEMFKDNINIFF